MKPKEPRRLQPEERALWKKIQDQTIPLFPARNPGNHSVRQERASGSDRPQPRRSEKTPAFQIGEKAQAHDYTANYQPVKPSAPKMDNKAFRKLQRGKLAPEARLDLHGMTAAQAHPALVSFVLGAHTRGLRLVLVITGKGRQRQSLGPIPEQQGILRRHVPHWLRTGLLGPVVLEVREAHIRHGGAGALYVYLRRRR